MPIAVAHGAYFGVAMVVAVGLVLAAVFVPCVFVTGIVGQFYQQFAVTIAVSTLISAFNSLTLSPALCKLLLKPHHEHAKPKFFLFRFVLFSSSSSSRVVIIFVVVLPSLTSRHHQRIISAAAAATAL